MTRTVYYTATTLDGYLADEHDSLDWLFKQELDEAGPLNYREFSASIGAMVMGSTTYQWVLDHENGEWRSTLPTWVFTHRELPAVENVNVVQGDVASHHDAIAAAAGGKDVWMVGGGDLAAQFAEAGLLDEVMLSIAPVTLGAGRPLLPCRFDLALTSVDRNGAFLCARYDVVGPLAA